MRSVMESVVRQRGMPSPYAASRKACGTSRQHLLRGARNGRNHHDSQRHSARQRREVFLGENDDSVSHNADHDRRHAVQNVGGEADDIAETVAAVLREVDTRTHAHRHSQNAGQGENKSRAHDGIGHSPARFAHRLRSLGEEGPVDRPDAAIDKVGEYRKQRHQHQDDGKHGHAGHDMVGDAAPQSDGRRRYAARKDVCGLRHWPSKAGRG